MGIRKIVDKTDPNNTNENGIKTFPTQTQRDPSKEYNQKRPTSLRSSGTELDPCVEPGYVESTKQPKE